MGAWLGWRGVGMGREGMEGEGEWKKVGGGTVSR